MCGRICATFSAQKSDWNRSLRDIIQNGARILTKSGSGGSRLNTTWPSVEQLEAQLSLQRLDLLPQRRLLHIQPYGRARDRAVLDNGDRFFPTVYTALRHRVPGLACRMKMLRRRFRSHIASDSPSPSVVALG